MSYLEQNRGFYDRLARSAKRFAKPATREELRDPVKTLGGLDWLGGTVHGQRVLCLAAGGGRQGPLYAAAGGDVTVVDISPEMLALDRRVAMDNDLAMSTIEASIEDLSALPASYFDVVVQPVSTCYVPDVAIVFRQVARVIREDGTYVSQHKQPISLQGSIRPRAEGYWVREPYYLDRALDPSSEPSRFREQGAVEYLHRWEQLIGWMCRAGFVVEDLVEPRHADPRASFGQFGHRCQFIPPYVRIKARRKGGARQANLWERPA